MPSPKPARRPEARPDEILDAALEVFSDKGFALARVDDIAKAAGLSKGAVYLYFDSKEALLEALIERSAGRIAGDAAAMVEAAAEADPAGTLRNVIRAAAYALADPKIAAAPRLVLSDGHRFPRIASYYRRNVVNVGLRAMERLVAAGVRHGVFREVDHQIIGRALIGPMLANMILTYLLPDPDQPALAPDDLADNLADLLLSGLSASTHESPS